MAKKHAEIPWAVKIDRENNLYNPETNKFDNVRDMTLVDKNGKSILYRIIRRESEWAQDDSDTAFIIKSVNSHETLVRLLKRELDELLMTIKMDHEQYDEPKEGTKHQAERAAELRAALKEL